MHRINSCKGRECELRTMAPPLPGFSSASAGRVVLCSPDTLRCFWPPRLCHGAGPSAWLPARCFLRLSSGTAGFGHPGCPPHPPPPPESDNRGGLLLSCPRCTHRILAPPGWYHVFPSLSPSLGCPFTLGTCRTGIGAQDSGPPRHRTRAANPTAPRLRCTAARRAVKEAD